MKKIKIKNTVLLICFGILFFSCNNNDDESFSDDLTGSSINYSEDIQGTWSWIESSGGIQGSSETPESSGNTIKLEISNDVIKKYINGSLVSSLSYELETNSSIIFGEPMVMIAYENQFNQTIILEENKLILVDECLDCFQNSYEKE